MRMDEGRRIVIPEHVMLREVGGETVLLNLDSETYFGLDGVGTELLRQLRDRSTLGEAIDALLPLWDIDRLTLASDAAELLDELFTAGLIAWE